MSMPLLCKIFGHKTTSEYTQPEERFVKRFNNLLNEPLWYEQFLHKCVRQGCAYSLLWSRWTKAAARKTLEDQGDI